MNVKMIKEQFLDFFVEQEHHLLENRGLIPHEADPSSLFINSGVHAIKPYVVGAEIPPSNKLTSNQSCVRTIDIDRVGKNVRTLTYFNMLGSWSIGDYWKEKALELALTLLTDKFKLNPKDLAITVFEGSQDIPRDEESIRIWQSLGIKPSQIYQRPKEDNWWSMGDVGPCGPCTEVYFDRGSNFGLNSVPGDESSRFVEIWNAGVFMTYFKNKEGSMSQLVPRVVDTGAGLERLTAILQKKNSVFDIFPLEEIGTVIREVAKKDLLNDSYVNIISDHLRASSFIADEGVKPSNKLQGYVLRRLIRRALYHSVLLGISEFDSVLKDTLPILDEEQKLRDKDIVYDTLHSEYCDFQKVIARGQRELDKIISSVKGERISGEKIFHLYETYGFPVELTREILTSHGLNFDLETYDQAKVDHQQQSRKQNTAFLGGLGSISEATTKYHTLTHLLQQALRDQLGNHVSQAGSNITEERLRFDFYHTTPLSNKQLKSVEELINQKIAENLSVSKEELPYEKAVEKGAIALFDKTKYPEKVTVYSVGEYSLEICMGPHVRNTSEIGRIKIMKEQSVAKGVRRIYAQLDKSK